MIEQIGESSADWQDYRKCEEELVMSLVSIDQCRDLLRRFIEVRRFSERLVEPLSSEDCLVQSMPDVSPTKWHLAHTTWFFETFVLSKCPDYRVHDERYAHLFNSYYNTIGALTVTFVS